MYRLREIAKAIRNITERKNKFYLPKHGDSNERFRLEIELLKCYKWGV